MKRCSFQMFLICLLSVLIVFSAQVNAIEKVDLSISSIVLFALHENPDIGMAQEKAIQSEYFIEEAKAGYYPTLQMSASAAREYNNPASGAEAGKSNVNNSGSLSLVAEQLLFDGFETVEEVRRRKELTEVAHYQTRGVINDVLNDAINYYLSIYRYQKTLDDMDNFITEVDKVVETIKQMYEAGAASKAMLDYAQSRRAFARTEYNDAMASLNDALSNLEFLTGRLPPFNAIPPDRLHPDKLDIDEYLDFAMDNNTNLKLNESDKMAMKHSLNIERSAYYPEVSFRMEAGQKNNDGGEVGPDKDVKALFSVQYEIFDGFARKNATKRTKSQIKELDIREEKIVNELKKQIKLYYNQIQSIKSAIESTQDEIVSNEALQELNRENFKLGTINLIELIEGEERLNAARIREHTLMSNLYLNTYQLLLEVGSLREQYFCDSC